MRKLSCTIISLFFMCPPCLMAEPASPKSFYPEGFTGGLVNKDAANHFEHTSPKAQEDKRFERHSPTDINVTGGLFDDKNVHDTSAPEEFDLPSDPKPTGLFAETQRKPMVDTERTLASSIVEKKGIPVLGLGVLVSVNDQEHLVEQMQTMTEAVKKFNIPLTNVYFMGDYVGLFRDGRRKNDIGDALAMIPGAGGQLKLQPKLPEKYQVSESPVWVLSTQKGEIVLEGIPNLFAYMNSDGEFVNQESYDSKAEDVTYDNFEDQDLELLMKEDDENA